MPPMPHTARPHILHEATYRQVTDLQPNVAVLPWAATEAHNYHLPHGTDTVQANALAEQAVAQANEQGGRCVVLPCVPFGVDHTQVYQSATITMRVSTQAAVLKDVAESLVRQGIDRLVVVNFHGGNEFRPLIRDVMFDLPISIVQVHGHLVSPEARQLLDQPAGDHADEYETSLMLHLAPEWVAPLESAGDGATTRSELPALTDTPGVWISRDWQALTRDTGVGAPHQATAEKGRRMLEMMVHALTPVLVQLSQAERGQFPFVIRD